MTTAANPMAGQHSSPAVFGWLPVWRRNFLVWRKLALPSVLGNLADPRSVPALLAALAESPPEAAAGRP